MFSEKIEQLTAFLEKQELEAPTGIVSAHLYTELFAAYLYRNDLNNAKYLWMRIPQSIKNGNTELECMFVVFQCLWNNDTLGFYKAMNHEWSKNVAELMFELKEKVQKETIDLVARTYSSIFENVFAEMTNQTTERIEEICRNLDWEIVPDQQPRLIKPKKPIIEKVANTTSEEQLNILTSFVSFLEN